MPAFAIIVPCRLESTRFPRKLLHPIKDKPLVLWVAERITAQAPDYPLWFAVDHPLLAECIEGAGFRAIMTDASHQSGTKRIVDFYNTNQVKVVMSSASPQGATDKSAARRALYFSRSRMPYSRDLGLTIDDAWVLANPCFKHLGLYAYKADFLEKFVRMAPGQLEQIEKLEQLRVLENGYPIAIDVTEDPTIGVDTPEDAKKFEQSLQ